MEDVDQSHMVLGDSAWQGMYSSVPPSGLRLREKRVDANSLLRKEVEIKTDLCLSYAKYWFYPKPIKNPSGGGF